MGGFTYIGVIAGSRWRVTEMDYHLEDIESCHYRIVRLLMNNLEEIANGVTRCKFTSDIKLLSGGEDGFGRMILDELAELEEGETLYLLDRHETLEDELYCERAFVVNLDSNTLSCYHHGNHFLFGRYNLDALPDVDELASAYEMSMANAGFERIKIAYKFMENVIRQKHGKNVTDAEQEIKQFWEDLRKDYENGEL